MNRPIPASPLESAQVAMSFREGEKYCVQGYFATSDEAAEWHKMMNLSGGLRDLSVLDRKVINVLSNETEPCSIPYIASKIEGTTTKIIRHSVGGLECRGLVFLNGWTNCDVANGYVAGVSLTEFAEKMIDGDAE